MRALQLFGDRDLRITEMDAPPPPAPGRGAGAGAGAGAQLSRRLGLSRHGFRQAQDAAGGRASRRRARSRRWARASTRFKAGDPVTMYGAETCGHCKACREGRDNLCENVARHHGLPYRRLRPRADQPPGAPRDSGAGRRSVRGGGLRAHRLRHRAAHAVRQRQAGARRVDPRPCGRLRHRHGGDQDGEGHRLHGLSPPWATTRRARRPRRSAPITSSTTAPSASRARCAG